MANEERGGDLAWRSLVSSGIMMKTLLLKGLLCLVGTNTRTNKAKAISAKLLELNLKNKLEEKGKTR